MAACRGQRLVSGALLAHAASLGGPKLSLAELSSIDAVVLSGPAEASLTLENDGDIVRVTTDAGTADVGDWITPKSAAGGAYEVYVTVNSGTLSSGTSGSWLSLGTSQTWTRACLDGGSESVSITVELRKAASGVVMATSTISLTAESGI